MSGVEKGVVEKGVVEKGGVEKGVVEKGVVEGEVEGGCDSGWVTNTTSHLNRQCTNSRQRIIYKTQKILEL
jgi:hypothetical protein